MLILLLLKPNTLESSRYNIVFWWSIILGCRSLTCYAAAEEMKKKEMPTVCHLLFGLVRVDMWRFIPNLTSHHGTWRSRFDPALYFTSCARAEFNFNKLCFCFAFRVWRRVLPKIKWVLKLPKVIAISVTRDVRSFFMFQPESVTWFN